MSKLKTITGIFTMIGAILLRVLILVIGVIMCISLTSSMKEKSTQHQAEKIQINVDNQSYIFSGEFTVENKGDYIVYTFENGDTLIASSISAQKEG